MKFTNFGLNNFNADYTMTFAGTKLTRADAELFYTLHKYFNPSAPNIAVFGDKEKFKKLIEQYTNEFNPKKGHKIIHISNSKVTFLSDDIELTIVLVNSTLDLLAHNIKYRKFL